MIVPLKLKTGKQGKGETGGSYMGNNKLLIFYGMVLFERINMSELNNVNGNLTFR